MKRYFFIIVLALVMFSCSKSKDDANLEKTEDGKIVLRFWHALGDAKRSGWIQEKADEWNASQEEYFMIPEYKGSYRETLNAAVLADNQGAPPHLVQIFEVGSQLALDSGVFTPIGEVDKNIDYSDYIDPVLNYYTIEGKVNSLPFNSSSPILYYNKDLMEKAGLDPEKPPLTLEDIIKYSEIAKSKGISAAGFALNMHSWFFEQWVAEQGGVLVNNDNGRSERATRVELNSPELVRIVSLINELNQKGFIKTTGKLEDWRGSDNIFIEQQAMFYVTSTADIGNIADAVEGKFDMGTGYYPIPEGERNGTVVGGASVWLMKGHPLASQKVAQDFLLYMTNTENMADWHKLTGYYPVRKSSIELLETQGWFEENPRRTIAFTQLLETNTNTATAGALMGSFGDTRTILAEAVQKILNGADLNATLQEANDKAQVKLEEYNQNIQ